jgi:hypothetical protein
MPTKKTTVKHSSKANKGQPETRAERRKREMAEEKAAKAKAWMRK